MCPICVCSGDLGPDFAHHMQVTSYMRAVPLISVVPIVAPSKCVVGKQIAFISDVTDKMKQQINPCAEMTECQVSALELIFITAGFIMEKLASSTTLQMAPYRGKRVCNHRQIINAYVVLHFLLKTGFFNIRSLLIDYSWTACCSDRELLKCNLFLCHHHNL